MRISKGLLTIKKKIASSSLTPKRTGIYIYNLFKKVATCSLTNQKDEENMYMKHSNPIQKSDFSPVQHIQKKMRIYDID